MENVKSETAQNADVGGAVDSGSGEMQRRMVLGAMGLVGVAGVAALGRLASAGPINPPAGPVAGTGRTLDEVYNKIPGANGSGDGRIPIPGGAPFSIAQPGSYVLTGNITSASGCISISASDVTLDLNGYTLTCTTTTGLPLFINSPSAGSGGRVTVRNGTIVGGESGISAGSQFPSDILIEDVVVRNPKLRGIYLAVGGMNRLTARRCLVYGCGSTTTAADASLTMIGIILSGANARVEECAVCGMAWNGTGSPQFFGIQAGGAGGLVLRCSATNATLLNGAGVVASGGCLYRDNTVTGFGVAYFPGGTNAGGNYP
jgi:hypothetical protein